MLLVELDVFISPIQHDSANRITDDIVIQICDRIRLAVVDAAAQFDCNLSISTDKMLGESHGYMNVSFDWFGLEEGESV